jgi:hypothetical protein
MADVPAVLSSVKVQSKEAHSTVKSAVGPPTCAAVTVTFWVWLSLPPSLSVTVRLTV